MRRAAKRDGNEKEIVAVLRKLGASVVYLNLTDAPDLLVGINNEETILVETKTPTGKLRPGQKKFAEDWQGSPIYVIRSVEDAIEVVNNANIRIPMRGMSGEDDSLADIPGKSTRNMRYMWW